MSDSDVQFTDNHGRQDQQSDVQEDVEHHIYQGTNQATFGSVQRSKRGRHFQYKVEWNTRTRSDFMKRPVELWEFVCAIQ